MIPAALREAIARALLRTDLVPETEESMRDARDRAEAFDFHLRRQGAEVRMPAAALPCPAHGPAARHATEGGR